MRRTVRKGGQILLRIFYVLPEGVTCVGSRQRLLQQGCK